MNVADIQPGLETDQRVVDIVFGERWRRPLADFSTEDADAWLHLWPKIVEETGPGLALIWDRDKDAQDVGDDHTPGFRLVTGSDHWSAFETDVHGGVDVEAPTLALCLTRAALALYQEKP